MIRYTRKQMRRDRRAEHRRKAKKQANPLEGLTSSLLHGLASGVTHALADNFMRSYVTYDRVKSDVADLVIEFGLPAVEETLAMIKRRVEFIGVDPADPDIAGYGTYDDV